MIFMSCHVIDNPRVIVDYVVKVMSPITLNEWPEITV